MFSKIKLPILTLLFFFLFSCVSQKSLYFIKLNYMSNLIYTTSTPFFLFKMDWLSCSFMMMVTVVTLLVVVYSSIYLEHYNNKKFKWITFVFFSSMTITVSSMSWLNLLSGWDLLGMSSIFLVMFYPNKTSSFNSSMTMTFNRLGDMLLMLSMLLCFTEFSEMWQLTESDKLLMVSILVVCSFTKSAQFPLSSWLPAAMSAPTPISAMVHSSTLVTAGLFLTMSMGYIINSLNLFSLILWASSLSFLAGSILANLEKDTKKVVAFSTMSQISMIFIFVSMNKINLAMAHMIFHAMFKSALFCFMGLLFLESFSNQKFFSIKMKLRNNITVSGVALSLIMMTGVMYSSSYYTKDLVMEVAFTDIKTLPALVISMTSVMTMMYSSKLLLKVKSAMSDYTTGYSKYSMCVVITIYMVMMIMLPYSTKFLLSVMDFPLLYSQETAIATLFILSGTLMSLGTKATKLSYTPLNMLTMKEMTYSKMSFFSSKMSILSISEKFMLTDLMSMTLKSNMVKSAKIYYSVSLILMILAFN